MSCAAIYALYDPNEPTVIRYVGYAKKPEGRRTEHVVEVRAVYKKHGRGFNRKHRWINSLLQQNREPNLLILEELTTGADWQARERYWIAFYASDKLVNSTAGGEGLVNPTQEIRKAISETLKRGGSSKGNKHRLGIPHSEEDKQKISAGLLASEKFHTGQAKWRGKQRYIASEESCNKMSISKIGKHRSCEIECARKMNETIKTAGGMRWVTNGVNNKLIFKSAPIPEGFRKGRTISWNS